MMILLGMIVGFLIAVIYLEKKKRYRDLWDEMDEEEREIFFGKR